MKCIKCGGAKFGKTTYEDTIEVGDGRVFVAEVPAVACAACGEVLVDGPGLQAAEMAVARQLAASGEPTGASFRFMRKAIGYPAKTLAGELGIAPETVSRWENGERPVDAATWLLLAGMVTEGKASAIG